MGITTSAQTCATTYGISVDCSHTITNTQLTDFGGFKQGEFPGDPDVAGPGVLNAFVAVSGFSLALCALTLVFHTYEFIGRPDGQFSSIVQKSGEEEKYLNRIGWTRVCEAIILSCSDQQLFLGLAYAFPLYYEMGCQVSAYHYDIVSNLLLITCATHLGAVVVIRNYFSNVVLGFIRTVLVLVVYVFTGALLSNQNGTGFPTNLAVSDANLLVLPAACFESANTHLFTDLQASLNSTTNFGNAVLDASPTTQSHGWSLYIVITLCYAAGLILLILGQAWRFLAGCCCDDSDKVPKYIWVYWVHGLYEAVAVAMGCVTVSISWFYLNNVRNWMAGSGWMKTANGVSPEANWKTFGQLVPMVLILLTVFSFISITYEKIREWNSRPKVPSYQDTEKQYRAVDTGRR